jgi:hypothetical protein
MQRNKPALYLGTTTIITIIHKQQVQRQPLLLLCRLQLPAQLEPKSIPQRKCLTYLGIFLMIDLPIDLQQLILLSRIMLEKAQDEFWDDVFVLEAERRELIRLFFLEPVQPEYAAAVATGIQSIMAIDRDIMALGKLKRLDLAQILQTMDQGKKAVKAYTS